MSQYFLTLEPYDWEWPKPSIRCDCDSHNCGKPLRRYFYKTNIGPAYVDKCELCLCESINFGDATK